MKVLEAIKGRAFPIWNIVLAITEHYLALSKKHFTTEERIWNIEAIFHPIQGNHGCEF